MIRGVDKKYFQTVLQLVSISLIVAVMVGSQYPSKQIDGSRKLNAHLTEKHIITLPYSWISMADARSDQAGLASMFFMATPLRLVAFNVECRTLITGLGMTQTVEYKVEVNHKWSKYKLAACS